MPIHVPGSLNAKVLAAIGDALSRRFPGADIGIRSFSRAKRASMQRGEAERE